MKFNKKKGFTLIEIIVCIALIAVVAGISIISTGVVRKNIKNKRLDQLSDKIIEAVSVYIENNKTAKQQLYTDNNGVLVPLSVLQDEGLIDFQDIKIDSKKDYVITMLGSENKDGACIDTTTIGSWEDGSKTIYLCTNSDGTSNFYSVGFSGNNASLTAKNRIWFYGEPEPSEGISADAESRANNYITYGDRIFKIYYIDRDDSLALLSYDSFGNLFDGKTQNVATDKRLIDFDPMDDTDWSAASFTHVYDSDDGYCYGDYEFAFPKTEEIITNNGEVPIGGKELLSNKNVKNITTEGGNILFNDYFLTKINLEKSRNSTEAFDAESHYRNGCQNYTVSFKDNNHIFKIQLKPCMKINGGNGDLLNPYILKNYC